MWKRIPSAVMLALAALISGVILPIAVNIVTGGVTPAFLRPYQALFWPLIISSGLVIVAYNFARHLRVSDGQFKVGVIHPRNRERALAQVQRRIDNRLAGSLSKVARMTLTIADSASSVTHPVHLMVAAVSDDEEPKRVGENIIQAFEESDQSLLILGNPGSGKTTMLLELAQNLHDQAVVDKTMPIPVVIDLARWSLGINVHPSRTASGADAPTPLTPDAPRRFALGRRRARLDSLIRQQEDFHIWLIEQLNQIYKIPANVSEEWLRSRGLVLLLDGLDEVARVERDQCLKAINKFQEVFNVPAMAVTCRKEDYDKIKENLNLQSAVQINPLTQTQIADYLSAAGSRLTGVLKALQQDATLWQVLDSPLMLTIMVLAFHDRDVERITQETSLADKRRFLITAYVEEVTTRRNAPRATYSIEDTRRWLMQLAYSARIHRSNVPLRRSWAGWHMAWRSNASPSRARFMYSVFFPWIAGFSCSVGVILPIGMHLGWPGALVSGICLMLFQCSYVMLTSPVQRNRSVRVIAYVRLRRNGIISGAVIAALEYTAFNFVYGHEAALGQVIRYAVALSPLVGLLTVAAAIERFVRDVLIEVLWWSAIILGAVSGYLLYQPHANFVALEFLFTVAFAVMLVISALGIVVYLTIDQPYDFRALSRNVDWRSLAPPLVLSAAAMTLVLDSNKQSDVSNALCIVGACSGAIIGIFTGFFLAIIVSQIVSPCKLILASLDLLPFRLGKFLAYAADRSLLYKEEEGYNFMHAIFQDYFCEMYDISGQEWANDAYR